MNIDFTKTELEHIVAVLHQNEEEGIYWGRKDYHWNRHNKILNKIKKELDNEKI
jgi:hypothetical protein